MDGQASMKCLLLVHIGLAVHNSAAGMLASSGIVVEPIDGRSGGAARTRFTAGYPSVSRTVLQKKCSPKLAH